MIPAIKILNQLRELQEWSPCEKGQVAAVVYDPFGFHLASGHNGFGEQCICGLQKYSCIHAEIACLLETPFQSRGCTMYVTRFPCAACAQAIVKHGAIVEVIILNDTDPEGTAVDPVRRLGAKVLQENNIKVQLINIPEYS